MNKVKVAMKFFILFSMCFLTLPVRAEVLYGTQILKLYAQGRTESAAHLIMVNNTLPSMCSMNRLYIDLADKEIFAAALAAVHAGRPIDIIYVTDAPAKTAAGHAVIPCKVLSIF